MSGQGNRFSNRHLERFRRSIALLEQALVHTATPRKQQAAPAVVSSGVAVEGPAEESAALYFRSLPWDNDVDGPPASSDAQPPAEDTRMTILPGRLSGATQDPGNNVVLAGTLDAMRSARRSGAAQSAADGSSRSFFENLPWDGADGSSEEE